MSESPKDRRVPLSVVVFREPTAIPGAPLLMVDITPGQPRQSAGAGYTCPAAFLDPEQRSIWIEGREYPLERVHYWERAKMAKKVVPAKLPDYTIGKK